ncbi:three-helix bundle dimerization domain-containing protein [Mycobacterium sp.]|uniref:three-helix bundle dimerization domain-containing protein n=1 Tax=Mycobacterium sp. TaxID=1785 RepID=UPI0039C9D415
MNTCRELDLTPPRRCERCGYTRIRQSGPRQRKSQHTRNSRKGHRADEIARWCEAAAQQFVDAPIQAFIPILVENIVRSRMNASRAVTTSQARSGEITHR